jgi:glycosyltransferase involved in cell wall biosynthesis
MLLSFKGDGTLIGMNCVLIYRKGIDIMLRAMALLPETFKLVIMGDGKERSAFEQMAHDLGIDERVLFAGMQKDAFRFLPYYDIYAMPSRSEGFPLVLLEAAAYGTKVVASSLPVVKECFTDDEVITFDMPDAQALADAIIKAKEKKDLGKRLKQRYEIDYAPIAFYNRYIDIYGE